VGVHGNSLAANHPYQNYSWVQLHEVIIDKVKRYIQTKWRERKQQQTFNRWHYALVLVKTWFWGNQTDCSKIIYSFSFWKTPVQEQGWFLGKLY